MDKLLKSVRKLWYLYIVEILLFVQCGVVLIYRDNSYIAVHDNLDLFMGHYEMLKKGGLWFAHGVDAPILHGISRDLFGSEFNLYNLVSHLSNIIDKLSIIHHSAVDRRR